MTSQSISISRRKTTAEFISESTDVHGDLYGYSITEYTYGRDNVRIICREHGEFSIRASRHLHGKGCPVCSHIDGHKKRLKTTSAFISEAREKHGDRYDYSLAEYTGASDKVKIICRVHGVFDQAPSNHIGGRGCPVCATALVAKKKTLTQSEYIAAVTKKHGGKYDYSLTVYAKNYNKIKIICPAHGVFEQNAGRHKGGSGCSECAKQTISDCRKQTHDEFIEKCIARHGDKYDYSLAEYTAAADKVKIICPAHGVFEQNAAAHQLTQGCPLCAHEAQAKAISKTTPEFISESMDRHGDKYDYSLAVYTGYGNKVKIICPIHGLFKQNAGNHMTGTGCPRCQPVTDNDLLYIHRADRIRYNGKKVYKIGVTSQRLERQQRVTQLEKSLGSPLVNLLYLHVDPGTAMALECEALLVGEDPKFIPFDGSTEYRAICDEDLQTLITALEEFRVEAA